MEKIDDTTLSGQIAERMQQALQHPYRLFHNHELEQPVTQRRKKRLK